VQANQDTDSYFGYEGSIASLLLAICDAELRFIYVSAGAPACVGDAGLFARTKLKESINTGWVRTVYVPLHSEDGTVRTIWPYLVGDSALPLGPHLLKAFDAQPNRGFAETQYNKNMLDACKRIEQVFGTLKGRWVSGKKNTFWNSPPSLGRRLKGVVGCIPS
jgi:hypothetical protein